MDADDDAADISGRAAHKAQVGAVVALGYLVNLSGSEQALSFLIESTSPDSWKQRDIKALDATSGAWSDLSKYAIISLGLTGNDKAAAHLKSLRDPSLVRTLEDARFLTKEDDVVSDSLRLNQQISRDGLIQYYKGDKD
jgi:hypothetical protein